MSVKTVYAAILGLGTVGAGTYEILNKNHDKIVKTEGVSILVKKVLDRDTARLKSLGIKENQIASSIDEIVSDPDISIVVEVIGGTGAAKTFILAALNAGKTVVTANKELIAKAWPELESAAKKTGAGLYFEASCGGGIPVIHALKESFQGDNITDIFGIINGTTNYILTKMSEEGIGYDVALSEAQAAGFAEADPTADVEGYDAMYKLSILSSLAFHTCIPYTSIYREGITGITARDIKFGADMGYTLKLLAIGSRDGNSVEVRVHPAFIKKTHPLSSVHGSFNAVFLRGDYVDDVMLYGRGAGMKPTGSAVVSDVVYAAKRDVHEYTDFKNDGKAEKGIAILSDFTSAYYLALTVSDKPGVLAAIAEILGKKGISIKNLTQRAESGEGSVPIVIMTHNTRELAMRQAIDEIKALDHVVSVDNLIRVLR